MVLMNYTLTSPRYKTGDESKIDKALIESIKTAIKMGYYHLDGAEGSLDIYEQRECKNS